ncbi:MAG: DUF4468 domain-containing protein [Bacteroidales bacterium]|jgi:hypothetical protein|nr:DUF4468 domain-containing protein [Bacteroidales bacterium]
MKEQWKLDDNGYVTWQKIIDCPGVSKTELYQRSLDYFIVNYSDVNSVIQERDIPNGTIIAKGIFKKVQVNNSVLKNCVVDTWYLLKTEIRDNRIKITLSLTQYDESVRGSEPPDIHYLYPVSKQYPFNPTGYQKDLYEMAFKISQSRAVETIANVEEALIAGNAQGISDNW